MTDLVAFIQAYRTYHGTKAVVAEVVALLSMCALALVLGAGFLLIGSAG